MKLDKLKEILSGQPDSVVKDLQVTSFPKLPKWSDLKKEYNPKEHSIMDTAKYPVKKNENSQDDFKRTFLALQKLAVRRVAQSMFATPVSRTYNYEPSDQANQAVSVLEELYKTQNAIDSENIERAKKWNASCQIVTIWRVQEAENMVLEFPAKFKIYHQTYSEMDDYKLYPITNQYGNLICMGIGYTDDDKAEHMDIYVDYSSEKGGKAEFRHYVKTDKWLLDTEISKPLEIFPVVYLNCTEPVWGDGTNLVEQLEEMESYQGLYIKRNALPTFTLDYGEITKGKKSDTTESSSDARRIIRVGKGGEMKDVTWEGAGDAVSARYERLRNAFFEQIQVPDTSFANMIKSNTSAENKELIFSDARQKAKDLGGGWEKMFYEEIMIVKSIAGVIFPSFATIYQSMGVRSTINPYSIRSKKEQAEYVSTAGDAMSTQTKVKVLGEVDDVQAEVDLIENANSAAANQIL